MATIIALCNQKGGVGKTTTTVNLGAALAESGQRVLQVDLDPQAALTAYWGLGGHELPVTVYEVLVKDAAIRDAIYQVRSLVHVVPANIDLAAAEIELFSALGRERILRDILEPLQQEYDFIFVDCPPNLGLLTINALVAGDGIIIPLQCEYLSMRGLSLLLDTLYKVKRRLNPRLEIIGILPTLYNSRTKHAQEVLDEVRNTFGARVFDTVIYSSIRFAESTLAQRPLLEYEPAHAGARAYRALAKEVLDGTRSS